MDTGKIKELASTWWDFSDLNRTGFLTFPDVRSCWLDPFADQCFFHDRGWPALFEEPLAQRHGGRTSEKELQF